MIDLKSKTKHMSLKKLDQQQKLPITKLKKLGQDLSIVFKCCSLYSSLKILLCGFFS